MTDAMVDLGIDQNWDGNAWRDRKQGAAVVASAGGILTTTDPNAVDFCFRDYTLPVVPGMRVETEVLARKLSGDATGTGIFYDVVDRDANFITALAQQIDISGNDWKKYKLAYTLPLNTPSTNRFLRIAFGTRTAFVGDTRWQLPTIRIGRGYGVPLVLARGLARLANSVPSLHASFPYEGVGAPTFNGVDTMTVPLTHEFPSTPDRKPLIRVTPGGNHWFLPIAAVVTGGAAPSFGVKWSNGAAIQNVAGIAQNLDVYFEIVW